MVQEIQDPGIHSICSELTSNSHGKQFYLMPIPENITLYDDLLIILSHLMNLSLALGVELKTCYFLIAIFHYILVTRLC